MKRSSPIRLPDFRSTEASNVANFSRQVVAAAQSADDWVLKVVCEQVEDTSRQWLDQIKKAATAEGLESVVSLHDRSILIVSDDDCEVQLLSSHEFQAMRPRPPAFPPTAYFVLIRFGSVDRTRTIGPDVREVLSSVSRRSFEPVYSSRDGDAVVFLVRSHLHPGQIMSRLFGTTTSTDLPTLMNESFKDSALITRIGGGAYARGGFGKASSVLEHHNRFSVVWGVLADDGGLESIWSTAADAERAAERVGGTVTPMDMDKDKLFRT